MPPALDPGQGALKGREDAEAYVREVRGKILRSFGPFPERTDLKPVITGTLRRDGYRVEKVIFESRPDFLVTANLYIPRSAKPAAGPAWSGPAATRPTGRRARPTSRSPRGWHGMGYVVFIFDPLGQGERLQYAHAQGAGRASAVGEHLLRPGTSSSWSASSSARGGPGTASARSTTC